MQEIGKDAIPQDCSIPNSISEGISFLSDEEMSALMQQDILDELREPLLQESEQPERSVQTAIDGDSGDKIEAKTVPESDEERINGEKTGIEMAEKNQSKIIIDANFSPANKKEPKEKMKNCSKKKVR